jgi:hypothetical protein
MLNFHVHVNENEKLDIVIFQSPRERQSATEQRNKGTHC